MDEDRDYRDVLRTGLRRAGIHWLRAGYEVVAGWGALLTEVADARRKQADGEEPGPDDDHPVRIELD